MCKEASFVLTKENVYWCEMSDSHSDIIEEYKLEESIAGKINILKVEIYPKDKNYSLPLEQWKFSIDQDLLPDWHKKEKDEERTRSALKEWANKKIKVTVDQNSGDRNSGNSNSGDRNSGDRNSGYSNSGYSNSGYRNSGNSNSGYRNSGNSNSGNSNSGNSNSGDWNSGDRNSGNSNSGYSNSGDWDSGNSNSGYSNSGYSNSGDWNSGNSNSGDRNSGDWNSGNSNSGVFCVDKNPKIKTFDIESVLTIKEWNNTDACKLLSRMNLCQWINESDMTEKEKTKYPEARVLNGYLKKLEYKKACSIMWKSFSKSEKKVIHQIPNFDAKKFEAITGIEELKP